MSHRLTSQQVIDLSAKLEKVCKVNPETNFAEYKKGWSDRRLAKESNGEYTYANVYRLRQNIIGLLYNQRARDQEFHLTDDALPDLDLPLKRE